MDVRPGYKRTEVGVIPDSWSLHPLGELGKWLSGGTPSMSIDCYWSGEFPWVSSKDMKVSRLHDSIDHITSKAVADGARLVPAGAVLIVIRGMILAHSFPVGRAERSLAFNQDIKAVIVGADVDSNFLLYWLMANAEKLRGLTTESTHGTKRLPTEMLFRELVACPPPLEQEAIADALSDADALIESLEQLLTKKRQIKKGAMQELLTGKTRLPGFSKEWEVKRLGDIAFIKTGTRNNQDKSDDGEYPFFVRSETVERISSYSYDCEAILIPGEGGIGSIFHYISGRFDVHQRVYAITQFSPGISGRFVNLYMIQKFGPHAKQNSVKATVDSLRLPTFQKFELMMPPTIEEQVSIATILSHMDAEIAALEAKLSKVRLIKQGMMQELLTGKVRLV